MKWSCNFLDYQTKKQELLFCFSLPLCFLDAVMEQQVVNSQVFYVFMFKRKGKQIYVLVIETLLF